VSGHHPEDGYRPEPGCSIGLPDPERAHADRLQGWADQMAAERRNQGRPIENRAGKRTLMPANTALKQILEYKIVAILRAVHPIG